MTTARGIIVTEPKLPPCSSPQAQSTSGAYLPGRLVERAQLLVGAVHDYGPPEVAALIRHQSASELRALAVVLAAMVPADASPRELLAWNDDSPTDEGPRLRPHGTHAAFNGHRKRGEQPCEFCVVGERTYQRHRARRRRRGLKVVREVTA